MIFILIIVFSLYKIDMNTFFEELFSSSNEFLVNISLIFLFLFTVFMILIPYLAVNFGIRYDIRKQERKRLPFKVTEDLEYYRDLFKGISIATLSLLTNLKLEKKDISAMILI